MPENGVVSIEARRRIKILFPPPKKVTSIPKGGHGTLFGIIHIPSKFPLKLAPANVCRYEDTEKGGGYWPSERVRKNLF